MEIKSLVAAIQHVHRQTQKSALQQVNYSLTLRNWLIGYYLVEFEQKGKLKAAFGEKTYRSIASALQRKGVKGMSFTNLHLFKQFYLSYPQFVQTVSEQVKTHLSIQTLSEQLRIGKNKLQKSSKRTNTISVRPELLLNRLSFSHFIELLRIAPGLKRNFYEIQSVKNIWSVRELKRAIETSLYERTGLSSKNISTIKKLNDERRWDAADIIKSPYVLEFLGLDQKPEFTENDLEQGAINHLQTFLIEMGRGFCFEARQKRITFDNKHYFIDLVFYHRILRCHVLIDLKLGSFDHSDAGQMNLYLNYYKEEEQTPQDNPPIGLILCADKNDTLVKYATGGLSKKIFVGKYMIQLPSEAELKKLIETDTRALAKNEKNKSQCPIRTSPNRGPAC